MHIMYQGRSSNAALMQSFVETAFVFFPSVRTGMVMMHEGEGTSTFLTLAFFTVVAMAVCGFFGISKKTLVFVFAILDVLYAFLLFAGDDGLTDEDSEDARRENNTHRAYRENTYRASSGSSEGEESYSSGSKRYAGFEYEDEDTSGENEYSYSHSESTESSYGSYYDDYYYDGDGYNEYKRENYDYDFSEDEEDDEDEESEQKESSQQSESSGKSSDSSYNSSSGSGSYTSSRQESDFDKALRVFGVKLPFSSADLKKRRNELVRKNHPDHGGTNEKMIEINKAYDLLKRYAS